MHLHYVHSIGIKLWRKISYNIPLKCKCFFRVKDNIRNIREWSFRKEFTDMVSCALGQWCYNFAHSEGLGMEDIWGNGKVFFLFLFFYKRLWMCGRNIEYMEWLWQRGRKVPDYGVFLFFFFLEKAMATHSSILAWKIPWMEEPGRLQSMGSLRVGDDWMTSLSLFTFMQWRRKWQPTPVFLPGESQGWESLVGCHLWGHTESDTTEAT